MIKLNAEILLDTHNDNFILNQNDNVISLNTSALSQEQCNNLLDVLSLFSSGSLAQGSSHRLVQMLTSAGYMQEYNDTYINTPLEKTHDYFWRFHHENFKDVLDNLHITIVGCGGLGSNTALNLLLSGFSRFHFIDYDTVNLSNLNRQHPYNINHIGHYKAQALANILSLEYGLSPKITFQLAEVNHESNHENLQIPMNTNLIVSAIDSPPIECSLHLLNALTVIDTPVIFGGVSYDEIKLGPLLTNMESRNCYIESLKSRRYKPYKTVVGSTPATNQLLCGMMTNEIINYFLNVYKPTILNKERYINVFTLETVKENTYG